MGNNNGAVPEGRITDLRNKIKELEKTVGELKELGTGLPMIEKNARSLQSLVHVLQKAVPDMSGQIFRKGA